MPRKGKEPAGLRRWRLAHRKKRHRTYHKVIKVARRRYYGRKRKGGKSKSIPIAPLAPLAMTVIGDLSAHGLTKDGLNYVTLHTTGVDSAGHYAFANHKSFVLGTVAGVIIHKVANKTVNRYIPKWLMVKI